MSRPKTAEGAASRRPTEPIENAPLESSLRSLFSLDVLDGVWHKRDPAKTANLKWRSPEFYLYYVVFAVCLPLMFKAAIDLSSPNLPRYELYKDMLEPGLIPGRLVDNSDSQYASFRDQVPTLALVTILHQVLRYAYESTSSLDRRRRRATFDAVFGLVFLGILHGTGLIKLGIIAGISHTIAKLYGASKLNPILTWTFVVGLLFLNEWQNGYKFAALHPALGALDEFSGLLDRWHIHFNITALRLISFNLDYYWALTASKREPADKELSDDERSRAETALELPEYNVLHFCAYISYTPLYLAGPILTFNNYVRQCARPAKTVTTRRTWLYGVRFLVALLSMELVLHYIYVVAIAKKSAWHGLSPLQLSMLGYFNLHIIWLKLLIPWRFFRLWALVDGVETQENMLRCMSNNYSALAFWRAWHRSFNRWIVRYIYVPLGGANNVFGALVNMAAVFTFVAIWHDISLTLLTWGWLVVIFLIPEMIATGLGKKIRDKSYYRHVCALGGVVNVLMMMAANLVGFCVGLDGLRAMIAQLFGTYQGFAFLAIACSALFVGVQVMFEVREDEAARGIHLRC